MRRQLERLDQFRFQKLMYAKKTMDEMEWNLLNEYEEAFTVALSLALSDAEAYEFDETCNFDFDPKDEYLLPVLANFIVKTAKELEGSAMAKGRV